MPHFFLSPPLEGTVCDPQLLWGGAGKKFPDPSIFVSRAQTPQACFPCLRPNFTSFPHDLVAVRIREVRIAVRTVSEFLAASFRAVGRLPGNVLRIVDVRIVIADGCVMNILTVISNLRCLPFRFCPPAESICCFIALIKGIIADARHAPRDCHASVSCFPQ